VGLSAGGSLQVLDECNKDCQHPEKVQFTDEGGKNKGSVRNRVSRGTITSQRKCTNQTQKQLCNTRGALIPSIGGRKVKMVKVE